MQRFISCLECNFHFLIWIKWKLFVCSIFHTYFHLSHQRAYACILNYRYNSRFNLFYEMSLYSLFFIHVHKWIERSLTFWWTCICTLLWTGKIDSILKHRKIEYIILIYSSIALNIHAYAQIKKKRCKNNITVKLV